MRIIISTLTLLFNIVLSSSVYAQQPNPFESIGKKVKIKTAYGGRFEEFFDTDSLQRIGTVIINIYSKKIVRLLDTDKVFEQFSDNSAASRWYSSDPLAYLYFSYSPYNYSLNNPISNIDPDGRLVIGATKNDAQKFLTDLNAMFADKAFDKFRSLLSVKKSTFNSIDQSAFDNAVSGLTDDQKALAQTAFNTINSADRHMVEYASLDGNVSSEGSALLNEKSGGIFAKTMENNDGKLKSQTVAGIWGSTTLKTKDGTYSIIIDGLSGTQGGGDYLNSDTKTKEGSPIGRPGTAGHEIFGHGRYAAIAGEDASGHHTNAIRMENLILRVMGQGKYQRTGEDHGTKTEVKEASKLPKL